MGNQMFKQPQSVSKFQQAIVLNDPQKSMKFIVKLPTYLWFDATVKGKQIQKCINQLKQILIISQFTTISEGLTLYNENKHNTLFIIICSQILIDQMMSSIGNDNCIKEIYIYCKDQKIAKQKKDQYNKIVAYSDTFEQLKQVMKSNRRSYDQFKEIPSFIKVSNNETQQLTNRRFCLYSLFLFKDRYKAKQNFLTLANHCLEGKKDKKQQINLFIRHYVDKYDYLQIIKESYDPDLQKQSRYNRSAHFKKNIEKIINLYTKQCFFFPLLNNLLRSSTDPTIFAYLRLPFKDLFQSIHEQYQKNKKKLEVKKQLTVYRGCCFTPNQIKYLRDNNNPYIEMQGFLSTSLNKNVAYGFIRKTTFYNTLLKINIPTTGRSQDIDYGFAQISKYSAYPWQQEVLINPLNVFKVISIKQQNSFEYEGKDKIRQQSFYFKEKVEKKHYVIQLEYGCLANISYKIANKQKITLEEQNIMKKYAVLMKVKNQAKSQGHILKQMKLYEQAIKFFQLDCKIQKGRQNQQKQFNSLTQLSKLCQITGQLDRAIQICAKCTVLASNGDKQLHSKVVQNLGILYTRKGQYKLALQCFESHAKSWKSIYGDKSNEYAECLLRLGAIYNQLKIYGKTIQYYQNSLKIYHLNAGLKSTQYAKVCIYIGVVYCQANKMAKAIQFLKRSQSIFEKKQITHIKQYFSVLTILGAIYQDIKQEIKSQQYFTKALQIGQRYPDDLAIVLVCEMIKNKQHLDIGSRSKIEINYRQ